MPSRHTMSKNRRRFIKSMALGAGALASTSGFRVMASGLAPYSGKLLVTLQLSGGADVTQLCDPKVNTPGELKINNWADAADPGEAGNIRFAPVGDNFNFFNRFGSDMVVVNGVDAQTNSHETGRLFNWTGSNAEGRPSLTALHAAANAPEQPLAYSVFGGGTSRTADIISYNGFGDITRLHELVQPMGMPGDPSTLLRPDVETAETQRLMRESVTSLFASTKLTPRQRLSITRYQQALAGKEGLARLAENLPSPDEFEEGLTITVGPNTFWNTLKSQMQSALLVFQSGLGSSADLVLNGFDSHENHDDIHDALYNYLANAIYYFWDYAEQLGLADRILLVVGSDFGRTNMYNEGNGKDHWPIGSYMLMEQGARWGNRVVGASDELHFARGINPSSLKVSDTGTILTPAHVHRAVQKYLGIDDFAAENGIALPAVEDIALFSSSKQTRV
ncbi:MAG: DUF1501 domain-containing protein [Luminiphilus sp.]|nr:DUF1501 domain-containing protein [Luminiphilus sp.]